MVVNKEILTDYKKIYEKAVQLVNEESKYDPPTEPYVSHHAARNALQTLKSSLVSLLAEEADNGSEDLTYKIILAFVYRDLGRIYHFTGESSVAEQQLQECIELMEEHRMLPEAIIPYVGALNEMGIVYANRDNHHKAHETLVRAEHAYQEFKQAAAGDAMAIMDIFGTVDEVEPGKGAAELESLYTLCTFFLSQVLKHLGQLEKWVEYWHLTLRHQLALNTFEPIDFALSTAALSQHFIGRNMFKEARHHLATAQHIMTQHEAKMLTPGMSEQQRADITETYKYCYAHVARYWAKYGLMLLKTSRARLNNDDDENLAADAKVMCLDPLAYRFPDMDVSAIEEGISADYILTFDDAKNVYHFVFNWLDRAEEYYKSEMKSITEYAEIIIDFAKLYENIAFFEKDPVSQAEMHERSAKYYEELLKLLDPVIHMSICRECLLGCGLEYSYISDIKFVPLKSDGSPTEQEVQKINQVCLKAIKNLLQFLLRLKCDLSIEEQRSVLYAYFHLGRLYFKLISFDLSAQLENMKNSLKYFKFFTEECAEHKETAALLQTQYGSFPGIVIVPLFEKDPMNQANMHKSRAKYYEDLLELLNPVIHMTICRGCWWGCAVAYSFILKIMDEPLEATHSPTEQEAQKINEINEVSQKAINNFLEFVKSYMDKDGMRLKSDLSIEKQRSVVCAYFNLGRLYFKMISTDISVQMENMKKSLKYFNLFTEMCADRPLLAAIIQAELGDSIGILNLAFSLEDPVNQTTMHTIRAKYYEDLLGVLNPDFHIAIRRDCLFGCGLEYFSIWQIKFHAAVVAIDRILPSFQFLMNQVCQKAIKNFSEFVESYMEKDGLRLKTDISVENHLSVLYAYSSLGYLHYQLITTDLSAKLENMKNSLIYYKLFMDGCEERKETAARIQNQLDHSREMVNLLPLKIANLQKRLIT